MNREVAPLCRMSAFEQSQPALFCFLFQWPLFACLGSARAHGLSDWLSSRRAMTQTISDWLTRGSLLSPASFSPSYTFSQEAKLKEFESCASVRSGGITAKMKLCKTFLGE